MVDDEILKTKLKNKLDKLGLTNETKDHLVAELNLFSNFLINIYLDQNNYGTIDKQKSNNLLPNFDKRTSR